MAMLGALEFHNRTIRKQFVVVEGLGKVGARLVKFINNEADSVFTFDPNKEVGEISSVGSVLHLCGHAMLSFATVLSIHLTL